MRRRCRRPASSSRLGELEGLIDQNRILARFLREHGVDVLFKSAGDGHHWHNWRDQLRDSLRWAASSGKRGDRLTGPTARPLRGRSDGRASR